MTLQLPPPIVSYLTRFTLRRRMQRVVARLGLAVLATLIWTMLWCLLDRAFGFVGPVRAAALIANALLVLIILIRPIARLLRRPDLRTAANEIERREPAFRERLQTVVSRLHGPPIGSRDMLKLLAEQLCEDVARRNPNELLPWTTPLRPWLACAIVATGFALLALVPVLDVPRLIHRYARPLADVAPAATTQLFVSPGEVTLAQGQTLRVRAAVERLGQSSLVLHVSMPGQDWTELPMPAQPDGSFEARVQNVEREMEYFVTGGDAHSDNFAVHVSRRPAVIAFAVHYVYPTSTALPPADVTSSDGVLEAPIGTEATIAIESSEPLAAARMIVGGEVVEAAPTTRPSVRQAKLTIRADRRFIVRLTSSAGVSGVFRGGVIRAISDPGPFALPAYDAATKAYFNAVARQNPTPP